MYWSAAESKGIHKYIPTSIHISKTQSDYDDVGKQKNFINIYLVFYTKQLRTNILTHILC